MKIVDFAYLCDIYDAGKIYDVSNSKHLLCEQLLLQQNIRIGTYCAFQYYYMIKHAKWI